MKVRVFVRLRCEGTLSFTQLRPRLNVGNYSSLLIIAKHFTICMDKYKNTRRFVVLPAVIFVESAHQHVLFIAHIYKLRTTILYEFPLRFSDRSVCSPSTLFRIAIIGLPASKCQFGMDFFKKIGRYTILAIDCQEDSTVRFLIRRVIKRSVGSNILWSS